MNAIIQYTFPLLFSNLTTCLEKIVNQSQFDTIALVHSNTTVDLADEIYDKLTYKSNYVWMRYNMSNNGTLKPKSSDIVSFEKLFFIYVLDKLEDWTYIYKFILLTRFDHRENQIYVVNKRNATADVINRVKYFIFGYQFYNSGILFWNSTGLGTGIECYTINGYLQNSVIRIPITDDKCNNDIHDKIFFDKTTNMHGYNLTVYGQTEPPRVVRTVGMINGRSEYSVGGQDVLIIETIAKHLNASLKLKLLLRALHLTKGTHLMEVAKNKNNTEEKTFKVDQLISYDIEEPKDFDAYVNIYGHPAFDMNSAQVDYGQYLNTRRYRDYTFLYPHDNDNFLIVVPKRLISKTEYDQILKSPLITVWGPIILSVTIVRYIFNKITKTDKNIADLSLQTYGWSLGMGSNAKIESASENLLLWWFCLATMLSGMILSSSMFQAFALQTNIPSINNLKELKMSGLHIHLPLYIDSVKNFFESRDLKLTGTFEYSVSEMISNKNTSNAYVIREGKFNILFEDKETWHVIQRFGAEHLSYKLHFYSAIENRMNALIQRCVEHGIVKYLEAKNKRLLSGSRLKDQKILSTIVQPVTLKDMQDSYLLYVLGIVLSLIIFIAEKIRFRQTSLRRNLYER